MRPAESRERGWRDRGIVRALLLTAWLPGCWLAGARRDLERLAAVATVAGEVRGASSGEKPIFVSLFQERDGTVSLASQLAPPAQNGARAVFGFAEDHVDILESPMVARKLARVLAGGAASPGSEPPPAATGSGTRR